MYVFLCIDRGKKEVEVTQKRMNWMVSNLIVGRGRRIMVVMKVRTPYGFLVKCIGFNCLWIASYLTGVLCRPEFHWSCLFCSVGTDNESGNHTMEVTLQEPGSVGIEEQNEDAETDAHSEASDTDEEHGLGVSGQSSLQASGCARFICATLF